MNNIHKVIWSRRSNAFVVVSELARSCSRGGSTRSKRSVGSFISASPLTMLATGIALAFGVAAPAWAATEHKPDGSVHHWDLVPPNQTGFNTSGSHDKNTAYGNAVLITGAGNIGIMGGSYAVEPLDPNSRTNTNPYAGIMVDGEVDVTISVGSTSNPAIEVQVKGENLHGIYFQGANAKTLTTEDLAITAEGKNSTGITMMSGNADISAGQIIADGMTAMGIHLNSASAIIRDGAKISVNTGGQTWGRGIVAEGTSELKVADSQIEVGSAGVLNATGIDLRGLIAADAPAATLDTVIIDVHSNRGIGVRAEGSAFEMTEGSITMHGTNANGIELIDYAEATLTDVEINATRQQSSAVKATDSSIATINGGKLSGTGANTSAVHATTAATVNLIGTEITLVNGGDGIIASDTETQVNLDGITLDVSGAGRSGLYLYDDAVANITGNTSITVSGDMMKGVTLETGGSLFVDGAVIEAQGGTGSAYGVEARSGSDVMLANTQISATGAAAARGVGVFDAGSSLGTSNGTTITATSSNGNAMGIYASDADLVSLIGTEINAIGRIVSGVLATNTTLTVEGSTFNVEGTAGNTTGGISSGSKVSLTDSTVSVTTPYGGSGWESRNDTQFIMSNSLIEYAGGLFGNALKLDEVQDAQINNSKLLSTGDEGGATALYAYAHSQVQIVDSILDAASSHADAFVSGLDVADGAKVNVSNSVIQASGTSDEIYAVQMFGNDTALNTSGQTHLLSSQDAVLLEADAAHVTMADTQLEAGGNAFTALIYDGTINRIDLGAGVVDTTDNNTLLSVERGGGFNDGRVDLSITDNTTLTGAIRDDVASLADLGTDGGTYLTFSNADYAGDVSNVRSLILKDNARLGGGTTATPNTVLGDVNVSSNAILGGIWKIDGTLHAGTGGRIAPGNSIGVITTGAINWGPGSIYEVEVNAAGDSDRVDVTGAAAANISNTALHVLPLGGDGDYKLDHDYTIMTATGGIDGQFTEASWKGNELIDVNALYSANQVDISLSVNQQALTTADLTANQRAVSGGALSVAGINSAADAAFLSADPAASFDLLSGEIHPSTRAGLMHSNMQVSSTILNHLRDRTTAPAGASGAKASAASENPLWVSYTHNQQTAKGDSSNTAKRTHKIDSITLGADGQVGADWHVGGAFTYTDSDVELNARRSSADIDSYSLAAYAGKSWDSKSGTVNFVGGLGHTWHDIDTKRNVELGGSQALKADYDARTLHLFGELSHSIPLSGQSSVEPYAGLNWMQHRTDGFTEKGGDAALKGSSGTDDIGFSTLGVRGSTLVEAGASKVELRAGLGWRHAFGDHQPNTSLAFAQGSSSTFKVEGAPIARNTAVFDVGAGVEVGRNTSVGLRYEGQAGSSFTQHAGNLYLETRF